MVAGWCSHLHFDNQEDLKAYPSSSDAKISQSAVSCVSGYLRWLRRDVHFYPATLSGRFPGGTIQLALWSDCIASVIGKLLDDQPCIYTYTQVHLVTTANIVQPHVPQLHNHTDSPEFSV